MDELDDALVDILGADDDEPRKSTPGPMGRNPARKGGKSPSVFDDEFYKGLAADAANDESSTSEADPAEMAKQLEGLDDMDAALFGGKSSNKSGSSTPKKPSTPASNIGSGGLKSNATHKKYSDFDEDDPLAGLLSDDEDSIKPKPKSVLRKQTPPTKQEHDSPGLSRRLEVERPPTRSGKNTPDTDTASRGSSGRRKREDDAMFDDEDVLGGMGLDSPRRSVSKTDNKAGGGKSLLDDLMGTGNTAKHLERPGTGEKREFVLDQKYRKSPAGHRPETKEEDMSFGGYMPSSAGGSRPSSRRSVRFEEDGDAEDRPTSRSSSVGRRGRGAASYIEDMVNKDDRDWLDIASNTKDDGRPHSEGSIRDKSAEKPATAQSASSEPFDWLGLSRIGSPDVTPRSPDADTHQLRLLMEEADENKASQESKVKEDKTPKAKHQSSKETDGDDWLGLGSSKKTMPMAKKTEEKKDDWLDLKDDDQVDGPGDYLGMGSDIDPDTLFSSPSRKLSQKADELFTVPTKTDSKSPFPWDGEEDHAPARSGRRGSDRSPIRKSGSSLAESAGGLSATLEALKRAEQPKPRYPAATVHDVSLPPATQPLVSQAFVTAPISAPQTIDMHSSFQSQPMQMSSELQRQQEMLRQQQQQLMFQQNDRQAELGRQMQLQQDQLRQQQQQQLASLQEQQNKVIQQQQQQQITTQPFLSSGSMGMMPFSMGTGYGQYEDPTSKIRQLEAEKAHLHSMLEKLNEQHKEEIKVIADSHRKQIDMIEDTFGKREERLKSENVLLTGQGMERMHQLEKEKSEMVTAQLQRQGSWERDKQEEIQRLKDLHRTIQEESRLEHSEALSRLRKAKDQEVDVAINASDHARSLQSVITQIEDNARGLGDLHQQVEGQHVTHLSNREAAMQRKDTDLKGMQERLERQQHDNEQERARLQGLITKLEVQLTEQTRHMDEDKWLVKQEESKLRAQQSALEKERKLMMESVERDRLDVERAKTQLLEEQKTILGHLSEERRLFSEERAQFTVSHKLRQDQDMRDSYKLKKNEADIESIAKEINEEKSRLGAMSRDLEVDGVQLKSEKEQIQQQQRLLLVEKEKLEQLALKVKKKSQDIEDLVNAAARAREEGEIAIMTAKNAEAEQTQRLQLIHSQAQSLQRKEKQIAEERLALAREKADFEKNQGNTLCINCRIPTRDSGNTIPNGHVAHIHQGESNPLRLTSAGQNLYTALPRDMQSQVELSAVNNLSTAIEIDRTVRTFRMSAKKDKDFLEDETFFLAALKQTPYHVDMAS